MTAASQSASAPRAPTQPRWWRPTWKRLGVSFAALFLTFFVLEGAIRLVFTPPTPVKLRDNVYVSQLLLVNGRDNRPSVRGELLPEKKREGELRIFVFGESSVQGAPWGYGASAPVMMYDQLKAAYPGRDLTVVNMGRGAAKTIDSYYFLVSVERFSPDIVLFYQGGNDVFHTDYEVCMASDHPSWHRAWRWAVEHSRLLWSVRAMGPALLVQLEGRTPTNQNGRPDACDPDVTFRAWVDLLVSTGKSMGAKVLVTTPVENPIRHTENDDVRRASRETLDVPGKSEPYRKLLACMLTEGCDFAGAWSEPHPPEWDDTSRMRARGAVWRDVAAREGVPVIDLFDDLDRNFNHGRFRPIFLEEVHLTLEGYWRLAWLWTRAISATIDAPTSPSATSAAPPRLDEKFYVASIPKLEGRDASCILLGAAAMHLRANLVVVGETLLETIVRLEAPPRGGIARSRAGMVAQVLLGWLRQQLKMDPKLPAALMPALAQVNLDEIAKAVSQHDGCSVVGAGLPLSPEASPFDY